MILKSMTRQDASPLHSGCPFDRILKHNVHFSPQCPQHVLVDFVAFPLGHGRSVTDFRGWDVYEARLRCPDDMGGDIGACSARRALKPKFY